MMNGHNYDQSLRWWADTPGHGEPHITCDFEPEPIGPIAASNHDAHHQADGEGSSYYCSSCDSTDDGDDHYKQCPYIIQI